MHNTAESMALQAQQQRQMGRCTKATLRLFFKAWYRHPTPANLIQWISFQRDLGYPLRAHQYLWLKSSLLPLWRCWFQKSLPYGLAKHGWKLCQEYEFAHGMAVPPNNAMESLWRQEAKWRAGFLTMLSNQKKGGIAIIGNGASLNGAGLGEQIDQHRFVLRFNRFSGAISNKLDNGIKLDDWVRAPD